MSTLQSNDKIANAADGEAKAPPEPLVVVYEVRENDIMLGRGAPMIRNLGNARFREVVSQYKVVYMSSGRHHVKNEIAKQVLDVIAQRQGRFLRRVESTEEAEKLGVPSGKRAWVLADNDTILEKVKQALRDKDSNNPESTESAHPIQGVVQMSPGIARVPQGVAHVPSHGETQMAGLAHNSMGAAARQLANLQALDTLARLRRQDEIRRLQLTLLQRQQAQQQMRLVSLGQLHSPLLQNPFSGSTAGTRSLYPQPASHSSRAALQALNQASLQRHLMSTLGYSNDMGPMASSYSHLAPSGVSHAWHRSPAGANTALAPSDEEPTMVSSSNSSETDNSSADEGNSKQSSRKRDAGNVAASHTKKKSRA